MSFRIGDPRESHTKLLYILSSHVLATACMTSEWAGQVPARLRHHQPLGGGPVRRGGSRDEGDIVRVSLM